MLAAEPRPSDNTLICACRKAFMFPSCISTKQRPDSISKLRNTPLPPSTQTEAPTAKPAGMPGGICIAPMPLLGVLVAFAAEGKLDRLGGGRWTASLLRLPSCGRTVSVTGLRPGGMGGGPTEDSFSRIRSLLLPCHGSGDAIRSCDHCSEDDPCRMCWACCGCSSNDAWSGRKDGMAGICGGAVRRNLCLSATEPCDGPDCALAFRCSGPSCCLRSNSPEWRCAVGILSPLPPLCQSASVLARWRPAVELLGSTSSRSCLKLTPVTAFGSALCCS